MSVADPLALFVARIAPLPSAGQDGHREFGNSLQMGQVLLGRVMRVEDDGGYVMDFGGGRHLLVESPVKLSPGEVLRGRVVELGERIVIQRLPGRIPEVEQPDAARLIARMENLGGPVPVPLREFVTQHFALFSPAVWVELVAAAGHRPESVEVLKALAFLKKLGVGDFGSLSGPLLAYLTRPETWPAFGHEQVVALATLAGEADPRPARDGSQQLAAEIARRSEATAELLTRVLGSAGATGRLDDAHHDDAERDGRDQLAAVMRWLLNAQADEAVCHRHLVLPFALNGELVEVEMTLFDQPGPRRIREGLTERVVLVTLNTAMLGTVGLRVRQTDRHLAIDFSSDSEAGLDALARGRGALERTVSALGYVLDRVEYARQDAGAICGGVRAAISEWTLSTDSLSVLV